MDAESQRGSSLLETAVAIAIIALIAGAATGAVTVLLHATAGSPVRDALQSALRRELPLAVDALKYRGAVLAPATVATTLPMPTGSPLAAELSLQTARLAGGALRISLRARALETRDRQTLVTTLDAQAPLPGTTIDRPGLAPAPTGAP